MNFLDILEIIEQGKREKQFYKEVARLCYEYNVTIILSHDNMKSLNYKIKLKDNEKNKLIEEHIKKIVRKYYNKGIRGIIYVLDFEGGE